MARSRYLAAAALACLLPGVSWAQYTLFKNTQPTRRPMILSQDLLLFDPSMADLRWKDNHWQLEAGGLVLKDFGRHAAEGRLAAHLIRELGVNQYGTVGSPRPVMEYWLIDGQPPRQAPSGMHLTPIDLETLRCDQGLGQWCVRDEQRVHFNFGTHAEDAQQAVAVIRRYGFTQIGHVGQGTGALMFFFAGPDSHSLRNVRIPRAEARRGPGGMQQGPAGTDTAAKVPPSGLPGGLQQSTFKVPGAMDTRQLGGKENLAGSMLPVGRQLSPPPLPMAGSGAERVPFEWRQAQVRADGRQWKLVSGALTLGTFTREYDAHLALNAVQFYRLSEHCRIGHPEPAFTYFLSAGQPPRGFMAGVERASIRPAELSVRQIDQDWALCQGERPLYWFGNRADEARATLGDIQRFGFDTVCRVGSSDFTFLVRTH